MAQLEQSPVSESTPHAGARRVRNPTPASADDQTRERDVMPAARSGIMPLVAIMIALAFGASAWFFYHQGLSDAGLDVMSAPAAATDNAVVPDSNPIASTGSDTASETTVRESATSGEPDILMTVHPNAAQMQAKAAKPRLAKATRPAPAVAKPMGVNREVALLARPHPLYPAQAMRAHEQGTVTVLAQVDVNGHVSDTRIVKRSGSTTLDRAASNEVRGWKFSPALHNGQPIVASVEVPVSYRLDQ